MTASAGKRCPREQCSLSFWFTPFIHTHPSKKNKKIPWEAPGMQMHAGKCVDLHPFIAANTLCAKCCRVMVKMLKLRRRALAYTQTIDTQEAVVIRVQWSAVKIWSFLYEPSLVLTPSQPYDTTAVISPMAHITTCSRNYFLGRRGITVRLMQQHTSSPGGHKWVKYRLLHFNSIINNKTCNSDTQSSFLWDLKSTRGLCAIN